MPHPPRKIKHPPVFRGFSLSLERANERGVSDSIAGLPEMLCRGLCAESVCPTAQDVEGRDGHVPESYWGSGVGMDVSSSLLLGAIKRRRPGFPRPGRLLFRSAVVTPTSEVMGGLDVALGVRSMQGRLVALGCPRNRGGQPLGLPLRPPRRRILPSPYL
jgi:hypothetical protein